LSNHKISQDNKLQQETKLFYNKVTALTKSKDKSSATLFYNKLQPISKCKNDSTSKLNDSKLLTMKSFQSKLTPILKNNYHKSSRTTSYSQYPISVSYASKISKIINQSSASPGHRPQKDCLHQTLQINIEDQLVNPSQAASAHSTINTTFITPNIDANIVINHSNQSITTDQSSKIKPTCLAQTNKLLAKQIKDISNNELLNQFSAIVNDMQ